MLGKVHGKWGRGPISNGDQNGFIDLSVEPLIDSANIFYERLGT
jgi:hypothetical protein